LFIVGRGTSSFEGFDEGHCVESGK